jgi:cyclopropane fatty-acyl-phospholipid synthase-like methyltransferase
MVNKFYNLVTDFYEYGWGESFHFGPRARGETFHESLRRHEYYLALRLGLDQNKLCADFGCGVGGPMRNIARFSGAKIVGINNNDYQIKVRAASQAIRRAVSSIRTDADAAPSVAVWRCRRCPARRLCLTDELI